MISRNSEGGFFSAHWDWLVCAFGILALLGSAVFFVLAGGGDPDESADDIVRSLDSRKKSKTGVELVSMTDFNKASKSAEKPAIIAEIPDDDGSFLVSARRIFCEHCQKPMPGELKVCPACNEAQPEEVKVETDSDGDGLPNEWELQYGLDPNDPADADADPDGDLFTNAEEYAAKTDPNDKDSHPDYLDDLKLVLPLKETVLPFYLRSAVKTPNGIKLEFFDPKKRNDYGNLGLAYSIFEGAEIGQTGFVAKKYEQKQKRVKIKGGGGAEKTVDVSFVTIVRKSDHKTIDLAIDEKRKPVDVQAHLIFERGTPVEFSVVPGDMIKLNGIEYKVTDIKRIGKGASVTVSNQALNQARTLEALEQ